MGTTRPDTSAPVEVPAEETARHVLAALRRQATESDADCPPRHKRPTLREAAKPFALPIGVVLTLVAMVAAAVVAVSAKADRADVQRLDDRLRGVEQAVYGQSEILKRIEERLPVAPPALTRTGE